LPHSLLRPGKLKGFTGYRWENVHDVKYRHGPRIRRSIPLRDNLFETNECVLRSAHPFQQQNRKPDNPASGDHHSLKKTNEAHWGRAYLAFGESASCKVPTICTKGDVREESSSNKGGDKSVRRERRADRVKPLPEKPGCRDHVEIYISRCWLGSWGFP